VTAAGGEPPRRLIIAITGASGVVYGVRALEVLRGVPDVETHLLVSRGGRSTLAAETDYDIDRVRALADVNHSDGNLGATIASGSYRTIGMLVAPCSVKTLSAIANSYGSSLISRAADVVLKERRTLVLLLRETPLHAGHMRLMSTVAEIGGIVMPPVPAFYHRPRTLDDIVDQTVGRALEQFGIDAGLVTPWSGLADAVAVPRPRNTAASRPAHSPDAALGR
jgi:4-hydroxy-3-polyprenylbenzoate decarboxylase